MTTQKTFSNLVKACKKSSLELASKEHSFRCELIKFISKELYEQREKILVANTKDIEEAKRENIGSALLDRLSIDEKRLDGMLKGLEKIAALPDPLDSCEEFTHANGMKIQKVRVPIGVILVVYEARPNVSTDTVGLAIKTGNAVILRGSRQTKFTNTAIAEITSEILAKYKLNDSVVFLPNLSREESASLIGCKELDLIIPRGGEKLKETVHEHAKAPVLGAGGGICHLYISEKADLEKASEIIFNAKTQRPSVCNALEKVLINEKLLDHENISKLFSKLCDFGVEIRADEKIRDIKENVKISFKPATEEDWETEYLDLILGAKTASSLIEAIEHINKYGTGHSDGIISEDKAECDIFCKFIDSACVYVNASTRFTDGEEFGFGAEIGISTQKLHARGPIGPRELTTYKYIIKGSGQVRK